VAFPAFFAETVLADVNVEKPVLPAAYLTSANRGVQLFGIGVVGRVANIVPVLVHILKVVTKLFHIPLELLEQQQAPPLLQGSHLLGSL
jgi:hypothetical protein